MTRKQIEKRLEYLRGEIEAERISYGEIAELQTLAEYIKPGDVQLLEVAGVKENQPEKLYRVNDLQGCAFMADTHEDPSTEQELRERFWGLEDANTEKFEDFDLDYISETWQVEFEEVKPPELAIIKMQKALDEYNNAGYELLRAWEIASYENQENVTLDRYPEYMPSFDEHVSNFGEKVILE